ncbi:transglutaminase domain-containing protein [Flavobacterium sp. GT3R68]|uniref:transglutaminase domain-containing protein n=1 Tax=Flavobacterium sp. GT3R68 TaxID=2594437 RepID=UPI000F884E83|nr:transglutaminase domain-containing protein [Flavobacterium sp. GT3R68]RTY93975.1 hypothetical protein EKL32_13925 [Flavobacterium sp. GSN2]TRW93411.1 hypothetical protein FNW07_00460 [Flavobacterium sp. GT3R68]
MMKNVFFLFVLLTTCSVFGQARNEYTAIDHMMASIPAKDTQTTSAIANYINTHFSSDNDKIRAVFFWTASNISYDVPNMNSREQKETSEEKINEALQTRKGVCIHYAEVFHDLAQKVGIESAIIGGYTKQQGGVNYVSHAWCGAKINNKWYVFDPTWGSGFVNKKTYIRKINNAFFKAEPWKIIATHLPFDYMWQFLTYPVSPKEFVSGKPENTTAKTAFDYESAITNYQTLSETEQSVATVARIEQAGGKNSAISEYLDVKKSQINYTRQSKVIADFNEVVKAYNEGVYELNNFIQYRNRQFKPHVSDEALKNMMAVTMTKLLYSQKLLNSIGFVDRTNMETVNSMRKSMTETMREANQQEVFVTKYLSKSKLVRKSMFYKLRTEYL